MRAGSSVRFSAGHTVASSVKASLSRKAAERRFGSSSTSYQPPVTRSAP